MTQAALITGRHHHSVGFGTASSGLALEAAGVQFIGGKRLRVRMRCVIADRR